MPAPPCRDREEALLLASSGELDDLRARDLALHRNRCPGCSAFAADLVRLETLATGTGKGTLPVPRAPASLAIARFEAGSPGPWFGPFAGIGRWFLVPVLAGWLAWVGPWPERQPHPPGAGWDAPRLEASLDELAFALAPLEEALGVEAEPEQPAEDELEVELDRLAAHLDQLSGSREDWL